MKEGAGKTGCRPGTHGPLCEGCATRDCTAAYRWSQTSGLPCAVVWRLMSRSPRGAMHSCPRRLAADDARARSDRHITANAWRQPAGARTTRFCRTQITPVVRAMCLAHGFPPCDHRRTDVARVHRRPARVRDDRDTPLFLGPEW